MIRPFQEFLVFIPGLDKNYYQESDGKYALPAPADRTDRLIDRGIIVDVPVVGEYGTEVIGKTLIFSQLEANSSRRGETPRVKDHILISPELTIQIGDTMQGQYVSCSPIPLREKEDKYDVKIYKKYAYDSTQDYDIHRYDYRLDCGIVDKENQWFPVGTCVWWGKQELANVRWNGGILVKKRNILLWGDESVKRFVRGRIRERY